MGKKKYIAENRKHSMYFEFGDLIKLVYFIQFSPAMTTKPVRINIGNWELLVRHTNTPSCVYETNTEEPHLFIN